MKRYTASFSEEFDKLLTKLADERGSKKSEIIRIAVATYAYLKKEKESSHDVKISITDNENNVTKEILIP